MQKMPEFIQATYQGENKHDYALKAEIAINGLAAHPEEAEHINAYASNFLFLAGKYEESVEYCRRILPTLTIWDCKSDTFRTLIRALEKTGQFQEAIEVRLQLMEEDDNKSHHLEEIAIAYKEAGNIEKSIEYYLLYIEECDNHCDEETYTELSALYESKGDHDNAATYLLQALRDECGESVWLWLNTGRMLALGGKYDEAKFYFEVALKLDPEDADIYYMLGQVYQNKKDSYRALHYYMQALKIQPEFAAIYNNMAALSFEEDGDIKTAIEHLQNALTMSPDNHLTTGIYLNLARLYHKICDYDMHKYYKEKMLEEIGFPPGFIEDE